MGPVLPVSCRRPLNEFESSQSRLLSYVLRLPADAIYLNMRKDGYVLVRDLLALAKVRRKRIAMKAIKTIVDNCPKQRFTLTTIEHKLHIRCNQGHSCKTVSTAAVCQRVTCVQKGEVCRHGTYLRHLESIIDNGLVARGVDAGKSRRNDIHFSTQPPGEAVQSGMRGDARLSSTSACRALPMMASRST